MKFLKKINKTSIIVLAIAFTLGLGGIIAVRAYNYTTPVVLGTAGNFAVLAGAGITDTTPSLIIGNAGSDPTVSNGLPNGEVTGTNYTANDAAVEAAKVALSTAYGDVSTRAQSGADIGTELAAQNLTAGVYHAASGTFEISGAGTLTLDGGGNPNSVFIFKTDTTLVTGNASSVVLTNGAQACNVFWAVGSAATLHNTTFVGTIMANSEAITDTGDSTINGRLLAITAAVTLNNTHVTVPTCAPSLLLQKAIAGGGPDLNTAWTLKADGALGTNLSGITGATGANSDLQFPNATFKSDTYTLSETGPATNYVATYSCDNVNNGVTTITTSSSIMLVAGDRATCTITNTYIAPAATLNVIKHVVIDNGGIATASNWVLTVASSNGGSGTGHADGIESGTIYTLETGHQYSVTEDAGPDVYAATSAGDCTIASAVAGTNYTCTITNDDIAPHLIVIKHVVNDNGGSALASSFSTTITGVTTAIPTAAGVESPGVDNILTSVGAYSIDEGAHIGYDKTLSADCSGTIILGQTKTCTITNNDIDPVSGGGGTTYGCKDPNATNYNFFSSSKPELCVYATITPVVTPPVITPLLPKTGFPPETWYEFLINNILNLFR